MLKPRGVACLQVVKHAVDAELDDAVGERHHAVAHRLAVASAAEDQAPHRQRVENLRRLLLAASRALGELGGAEEPVGLHLKHQGRLLLGEEALEHLVLMALGGLAETERLAVEQLPEPDVHLGHALVCHCDPLSLLSP